MAEMLVFRLIPGNTELVGDLVNVIKVICETFIFRRAGRLSREVAAGKTAVLVKFLKCAILKNTTSVPNAASLLMSTSVRDVLRPLVTSKVVFFEV